MRINTNVMALNAQNMLQKNQGNVEKSIQKLSSGLRINSAADDAAGLAISEKMRAQIRGLGQAESNAQDGISLLQTAEGALQQTTDILQRMRELVIKAQNTGVLTDDDRTSINTEMSTLRDEIDRIAVSTTFNGKKLLNGDLAAKVDYATTTVSATRIDADGAIAGKEYTLGYDAAIDKLKVSWTDAKGESKVAYSDGTYEDTTTSLSGKVNFVDAGIVVDYGDTEITVASAQGTIKTKASADGDLADFKIGANTYSQDILSIGIGDMSSKGLNRAKDDTKFTIDLSDATAANATLKAIDYAIEKASSQRSTLGSMQNRMEYATNNLSTTEENLTAAESRIRDVDMAKEMVAYTKDNILNQAAMAMLAQANKQPETILTLLQG